MSLIRKIAALWRGKEQGTALAELARNAGQEALAQAMRLMSPDQAQPDAGGAPLASLALLQAWAEAQAAGPMAREKQLLPLRELLAALLDAVALARASGERAARREGQADAVHVRTLLAACAEALAEYIQALSGDDAARIAAWAEVQSCMRMAGEQADLLIQPLSDLLEALSAAREAESGLATALPGARVLAGRVAAGRGPARRETRLNRAIRDEIGAIIARAGDPRATRHLARLRQLALELLACTERGEAGVREVVAALMLGQSLWRAGLLLDDADVTAAARDAALAALRDLRLDKASPERLGASLVHAARKIESGMVLTPGSILSLRELAQSLRDAAACFEQEPGLSG